MLPTLDIPQAEDLRKVRAVLHAVRQGAATPAAVAAHTGYSDRHVAYRLHAARLLTLIAWEDQSVRLREAGERLLSAEPDTAAERVAWSQAIERSRVVQRLAPDLLAPMAPAVEVLAERLLAAAQLSASTATRRARCLLRWRAQILLLPPPPPPPPPLLPRREGQQLDLFA
jgi:hypothetical protein